MALKTPDQLRRESQRAESEELKTARQRRIDIREVLATREGRSFVWTILGLSGYMDSFEGLSSDEKSFMAGKRELALDILRLIEDADTRAYPHMILENLELSEEEKGNG